MPKVPTHALIWTASRGLYELHPADPLLPYVVPGEEEPWLAWLATHTSFSFQGQAGRLNVLKESRLRGGGYWYAYHSHQGQARKCYLGRTATLTLARLEAVAQALSTEPSARGARANAVPSSRRSPGAGRARLTQKPGPSLERPLTSLAPPPLPASLVEREQVLSRLDAALAHPLTLVSAGGGWGKTTLLATWASRQKVQIAWLSLEELDNSPSRFWVGLITALRRGMHARPELGQTAVALLSSPQPPPLSACLSTLLNELASCEAYPAPLVLIMDDYQMIEEPVIHEGLSFFLEHLPAHLHLVLSSRLDPDLPLARLRMRGQMTEIREADLRFAEAEASDYLSHMLSPMLSTDEVRRLVSRTEGWIAGLQLAVLAMQKRTDRAAFLRAFSGSQRSLVDYVQQDILAGLPTRAREFLLQSAILSRLDASVCQAVTSAPTRAASQQMLAFLERANLFVVPLDEERHSYRLHELFREALLSTLHATQPEMVPLLHRRAADFYEARGEWAEAITHALQAADFSTAARLMEQTVELFWVRGEAATIARWVLALPQPLMREHARLALTTVLYLLYTVAQTTQEQRERIHQQARQLMARIEIAQRHEGDEISQEEEAAHAEASAAPSIEDRETRPAGDALLYRRLRLLRMQMDLSEALASGEFERYSSVQQEIEELDRDEKAIWQIVPLTYSFILHFGVWQEGARLLPRLLSAKERMSQKASPFASIKIRQYLVMAALEAGQLRFAYQESETALTLIEQMAGYTLLKGYFEIVLAQVLYQWNRLEEARSRLHTVVQDAAIWQHLDVLGRGYVALVWVELARGDWAAARQALHELEQVVQRERYGIYPGWLPALRAHCWLVQGQLQAASDWAAGVIFPQGPWQVGSYEDFPVVMRVYFAQRRFREALSLLDSFSTHLDRPTNVRTTLTYLAQFLVALHQAGKREQARVVAARLFALTESEGYLRVYLDEGELMRGVLLEWLSPHSRQHEAAPSSMAYVSRLLAAFEQQEAGDARTLLQATTTPALAPSRKFSRTPDGLTAREVEVLRLVAAGLTDAQIAGQLVISPRTVNVHLTSIYSKISVSSRVAATRYALEHHLA